MELEVEFDSGIEKREELEEVDRGTSETVDAPLGQSHLAQFVSNEQRRDSTTREESNSGVDSASG